MTRVLHTGDTHLGYQQYHRQERREDFMEAFQQVVEDAVDEDVDAVVHAGDLFHDRRPDLPDIMGALSALRDLSAAGIRFLAIVGNHETKRDAQWLDLFASLGLAERLDRHPTVIGETAFYGLDFVPRSQRDDLDYEFAPHESDHAALVAHGLFAPLAPDFATKSWDIRDVLSAASVGFDAVLLGDDHEPKRREVDGTWVTYCGSTERTSSDERDERGYNLVEFDDEARITRRGLPTRRFVYVDVDLAEGEGMSRVRERVGQYDLEGAVVVVTIEGMGDPVSPAQVEEFVREQDALVARVTDRRQTAGDTEIDVTFADPDRAVRERIRELGLSGAAREVDETIRGRNIPDTTVADVVEEQVRDLIDDGPDDAFDPAAEADTEGEPADDQASTEPDTRSRETADPHPATEESVLASPSSGGLDPDGFGDTATTPDADTNGSTADDTAVGDDTDTPDGAEQVAGTESGADVTEDEQDGPEAADGQASMEDYL